MDILRVIIGISLLTSRATNSQQSSGARKMSSGLDISARHRCVFGMNSMTEPKFTLRVCTGPGEKRLTVSCGSGLSFH